jgi:hypothetical protein
MRRDVHGRRGTSLLLETILATFLLALVLGGLIDCAIGAMDVSQKDYDLTQVQSLLQQRMEFALYQGASVDGFASLASSNPQYQYLGNDRGNLQKWVYEQDVEPVDDSLTRVIVSIYQADSRQPTAAPTLPRLGCVTTMVLRP